MLAVDFDERLALYGWLWDVDWGLRAQSFGFKIFKSDRPMFVHLYVQTSRLSGTGYGFSQIMNPAYFYNKGLIVTGLYDLIVNNFIKCISINTYYLLLFDQKIDRLGRLKGNFIALWYVIRRRIEPEILEKVL